MSYFWKLKNKKKKKNYGNLFDIIRLKADLVGIYNADVFRDISVKSLHEFIFKKEFNQTFPEDVKLLQLIMIIPTSVCVEKSFSAMKRIKSYTMATLGIESQIKDFRHLH